jgi:hypothetical protein
MRGNRTSGLDAACPNSEPQPRKVIDATDMNTWAFKSLTLATAAFFIGTGFSMARPEDRQPKKEDAVSLLESAIKADNPLPLLEKAHKEVQGLSHKGHQEWWMGQTLHEINSAITDFNEGDKTGMASKCRHAIADLHTGMAQTR